MAAAIARACGASMVIGVDINPYRLELARRLGAHHVLDARNPWLEEVSNLTGGNGADVVLEMSGNEGAIRDCLKAARNAGRVSLLGIPAKPVEIDLAQDVVFKALRLDGITGRSIWNTWYQTSALLGGILDINPLITHEIDMEDFEAGFELMKKGECGKVIMYPGGLP
jgi:threonine 3-dehydrogenase